MRPALLLSPRSHRVTAALLLALLAAARASAQGPPADGGAPLADAGVPVQAQALDVARDADGGLGVALPEPDGGVRAGGLVPPALVADAPARYPAELEGTGTLGSVTLTLTVDAEGGVAEARVAAGAHPLLDAAALHAAAALRFTPATLDGAPVEVQLAYTYHFAPPPPPDGPPPPPPVALRGLVRQKGYRRPLPGATVLLHPRPGPGAAATAAEGAEPLVVETDAQGRFEARVPGVPADAALAVDVEVRAPGHRPGRFTESLRAGQVTDVTYGVEPLVANPYETVVRADRDREASVSRVELHEQELREVPGTMGDPFRVVMLLPGVGSMVSGVSYPVVRGSQPASTGYFLDGIRVPVLFHLFLGPAVVHPDFIDGISFYPGTPPPDYGRLLGGAIDGKLTRPRDDRVHGSAYADLINAGLFIEKPFQATGTNVSVAGRYSYTPWLLGLAGTALQEPPEPGRKNPRFVLDFWDYQVRLEQAWRPGASDSARTRIFAFGSSDTMGIEARDAYGETALQSVSFHRVDLRHRVRLGAGELTLGTTAGRDRVEMRNRSDAESVEGGRGFHLVVDQWTFAGRAGYEARLTPALRLRSGADVDAKRATVQTQVELPEGAGLPLNAPWALATFSGAWAELDWQLGHTLTLTPGLRLDNYHLVPGLDWPVLEPRLVSRWAVSDAVTLKAGAGLFHQAPTTLVSLPVVDLLGLDAGVQQALQTSAGVEWQGRVGPFEGVQVHLDGYVNALSRTIEITPFGDEDLSYEQHARCPPLPPGGRGDFLDDVDIDPDTISPGDLVDLAFPTEKSRGLAYGLEVLVRKPLGGQWFGWLSYSLSRSQRQRSFLRYDARGCAVERAEGTLPFAFDQTHIANLVLSRKLPGNVTLGVVLHYNSGRPEIGGLTSQTSREGTDPDNRPDWVPLDRDRVGRLPGFFRVDARVSKAWVYDTFTLDLYLDVLNVTVAKEIAGWQYRQGPPLVREAVALPIVVPILGLKGQY